METVRANQVQNLWGSAKCAATGNTVLAPAPATIDDVAIASGDKVFLPAQADKTENGVWVHDGTNLVRPAADKNLKAGARNTLGASIVVAEGTAYAKTLWFLSATNGGEGGYENVEATIGTHEMEFSRSGVSAKELDADTADLSGAINGTNTDYTMAAAYANGTVLRVTLNGVVLNEGASSDFEESGGVITLSEAPQPGDSLTVVVLY